MYTKSIVSYLPDRMYFADWMRVSDMVRMFRDFYTDFRLETAEDMLERLEISGSERMKSLSKGTKEKVQLALVMSRKAKLYLLDEPIGGVDPAARDFILRTILTNYSEDASVILSTHLIADIEKVLDEVIFLKEGQVVRQDPGGPYPGAGEKIRGRPVQRDLCSAHGSNGLGYPWKGRREIRCSGSFLNMNGRP